MVSGFVTRRRPIILPLFLSAVVFVGCGMMSVLADEDEGGNDTDAGSSTDKDASPDGCGDGIIQGWLGEACEAGETGGATCSSVGRGTGMLRCNKDCQFDFSLCTGSGGGSAIIGDGGSPTLGDGGSPQRRDGGPII